MIEMRPVVYVIGLMLLALGGMMLVPCVLDLLAESGNAPAFLTSAMVSGSFGAALALSSRNGLSREFSTRQAYLLTFGAWIILPVFGALPFAIGAPGLGLTDAYFEAVSGITTTGSTVILGLEDLPEGMNLWRGMLNFIGGLGIAFVAMIFLPIMRVGGMQFFKVQGYDTFGKLLPRASDLALSLLGAYLGLTVICILTYAALGMESLDAVVMGMASIATGGFAPTDISFSKYPGALEYAGALFMFLGSLPYIRYVQLASGSMTPMLADQQVRAFFRWVLIAVAIITLWRVVQSGDPFEPVFRMALFNIMSVMTGTGFFTGDFLGWGGFAMLMAFVIGLIGGCSGSSSGALSVFRVQVLLTAIATQVRQIHSPNRIVPVKYDGRPVNHETLDALMLFATGYILTIGVLSVAMTLVGVDPVSALFGIWTSIGNIGYGAGPLVVPTGTFRDFPDAAKWILILAMLLGRMALLVVFVVLMPRFWRD